MLKVSEKPNISLKLLYCAWRIKFNESKNVPVLENKFHHNLNDRHLYVRSEYLSRELDLP
jgi:hypothetical protein